MIDAFPGTLPLDHVAVVVPSIEDAGHLFELLGRQPCSRPEIVEAHGARTAFCGQIELIEPLEQDSGIGRFLKRRGTAIHHVAYRCDNIEAELDRLSAKGFQLIDPRPRPGTGGQLVAFVHPRSTGGVLVELVQHGDRSTWSARHDAL